MDIQEIVTVTKRPRQEILDALVARDGSTCQYPGCGHELDFSITEGPLEVTIDHWMPKYWCREQGWSEDDIWANDNLRLMEKRCNAKKGGRVPNDDGSLPPRVTREFRYRRDKRAQRPEVCTACNAGRNLDENQWCNACGSGPQPARYPKWRQMSPKDCDHDLFFCWACHLEPELRRSALDTILTGGEGYEDAE